MGNVKLSRTMYDLSISAKLQRAEHIRSEEDRKTHLLLGISLLFVFLRDGCAHFEYMVVCHEGK